MAWRLSIRRTGTALVSTPDDPGSKGRCLAPPERRRGAGRLERTVPFLFSMSGETLDVGVDTRAPAGSYPHRFAFSGTIDRIEIELHPQLEERHEQELRDGQMRGALASQ